MHLFNPKTLDRHIAYPDSLPASHEALLKEWSELIRSGRITGLKETALHGDFKAKIVEGVLGYVSAVVSPDHTVTSEQSILSGSVDLALGHFGPQRSQILAPFELKGARTKDLDAIMPGRAKSPVQQAWEYATNAPGVKWVVVSNYVELRLYGFGEGTQAYEHFELAKLTEPAQYARFMLLLGAENLLSGQTAALLKESRREDQDITDALYSDYKSLRGDLIAAVRQELPSLDGLSAIAAAQTILDRILFTAFAEDTGLLPRHILEKAFEHSDPFNPRPIWDNFKGLFTSIDKGNHQLNVPPYNGGLFAPDPIVDQLNIPDAVCEKFKDIGGYDFSSEVSVTVLGHIFEQSIADVERLQAEARGDEVEAEKKTGTSGRRKRDGVVYTPDYIARFIVEQTLGTHLEEIFACIVRQFAQKGSSLADYEAIKWKRKSAQLEAWQAYRDRLKSLRIVDPACGSGVFLVMAFDYMKAELLRVNEKIKELAPRAEHMGDLLNYVPDSEILTSNLFGVDVNAESIEIAKLSLWVKTARRGKPLDSLGGNLKVGDSLIEDSNFAYLSHGFTWASAFPQIMAEGGFDIVLGNPPYVRMEHLKLMKPYLEKRFEVVSDRADLYCYFFERGLNLLKPGGRLGYISSSSFFKTGSGRPLRDFLRQKATIETVVYFGDLQVFEGVTTYPAILTMRREAPLKDHTLRFWTVDTLPESNFRANFEKGAATYPQSSLSSGSWSLEEAGLQSLRRKIRTGRERLGDVYGDPYAGIKTGRNEAFVIDRTERNRLVAADPNSADLIKPIIFGNELEQWHVASAERFIIYIPKSTIDVLKYPAILERLSQFKSRLEQRAAKQEWFELQQAQAAFESTYAGTKVVYRDIANRPSFSVDSGSYIDMTCFCLKGASHYEAALLGSNVLWFALTSETTIARGGYFRMKSQYLRSLPIPLASESQKNEIAAIAESCQAAAERRHVLQRAPTRRIPDIAPIGAFTNLSNKLKKWWLLPDFAAFRSEVKRCLKADIPLSERSDWEDWIARDKAEIARLSSEIQANERRINELVYGLFDLTGEEIELLESSI
ncbi:Eco57I restriction-modification methylase domain-containing protein [Pelagibacterium sp. WS-203]|uniref:Eco57I restriction-modification methylase domain-containing protein n=1 Tax=Devosiaceae TaxID=2831106 RepID=UPI002FCC6C88|tara:strand:- start:3430 stop:6621 length:3192 start_codon:yes stop_codon:yes gene_type:complete